MPVTLVQRSADFSPLQWSSRFGGRCLSVASKLKRNKFRAPDMLRRVPSCIVPELKVAYLAIRRCLRITSSIAQPPMNPKPAIVGYHTPQP